MALSRRGAGRFSAQIWPGFVDAMTALILVLFFVLSIFMIVQFVLRDTITGKDRQLEELSVHVTNLADALGLERTRADTHQALVATLAPLFPTPDAELNRELARVLGMLGSEHPGLLVAISRISLPVLLVMVVLATDPPIELPLLLQLLAVFVGLPSVAAWLIRRTNAARVELADTGVVLRGTALVVEIPYAALARVAPWTIPLPGPGLSFWLRSGRRLRYAVEVADPAPQEGDPPPPGPLRPHPADRRVRGARRGRDRGHRRERPPRHADRERPRPAEGPGRSRRRGRHREPHAAHDRRRGSQRPGARRALRRPRVRLPESPDRRDEHERILPRPPHHRA